LEGRGGLDSLVGSCEQSNEPSFAIKSEETLDWPRNCQFSADFLHTATSYIYY